MNRTEALCRGLESGTADLLGRVTPVTAGLLRWWFGRDRVDARGMLNFSAAQKQAILDAIVAHEVRGAGAAGRGGPAGGRGRPHHRITVAAGTDTTWVLQALLVWQWLNRTAAPRPARGAPGFTRHFLAVARGPIAYEQLRDAFCGQRAADAGRRAVGVRDPATADMAQYADLFVPDVHQDAARAFVRDHVRAQEEIGRRAAGGGLIALAMEPVPAAGPGDGPRAWADRSPDAGTLAFLAELPELMVFNDGAPHGDGVRGGDEGEAAGGSWQKHLPRIAAAQGSRFMQVDFAVVPCRRGGPGGGRRGVRAAPDIAALPPFTALSPEQLAASHGKDDPRMSRDLWNTLWTCEPPMDDAVRVAAVYNDHLAQLAGCVARRLARGARPVDPARLMDWLDRYVWTRLFRGGFDPLGRSGGIPNSRLLLSPPVAEHIARVFAKALRDARD